MAFFFLGHTACNSMSCIGAAILKTPGLFLPALFITECSRTFSHLPSNHYHCSAAENVTSPTRHRTLRRNVIRSTSCGVKIVGHVMTAALTELTTAGTPIFTSCHAWEEVEACPQDAVSTFGMIRTLSTPMGNGKESSHWSHQSACILCKDSIWVPATKRCPGIECNARRLKHLVKRMLRKRQNLC